MALSTVEKFVYALITFFPARRLRKNMDKKLIVLEGLIDDLEK